MNMKKIISMLVLMVMICGINISVSATEDVLEENSTELTEIEFTHPTEYEEFTDFEESNIEESADSQEEFFEEETTEYIPVEDIILVDFEHEMYVEDTQSLSTSVFPQDATEQTVYYSSSNTSVAKVDRAGVVTAISKGSCYINAYSNDHTSSYELIVKVKTEEINVVNKFFILKPNQEMNLEASVVPIEATQKLQYESSDENIISVDDDGNILAKNVGNASIIVTNGEQTISVSVIVNNGVLGGKSDNVDELNNYNREESDDLVRMIESSKESEIVVEKIAIVSQAALKSLYGTNKVLTIEYPEYNIVINGMDITNAENELNTKLIIENYEKGIKIDTSTFGNFPGKIEIVLKNITNSYNYFYMYDKSTDKYVRLNTMNSNSIWMSSSGYYYLTNQKMGGYNFNAIYIYMALGIALVFSLIYIFSRKKYWFW